MVERTLPLKIRFDFGVELLKKYQLHGNCFSAPITDLFGRLYPILLDGTAKNTPKGRQDAPHSFRRAFLTHFSVSPGLVVWVLVQFACSNDLIILSQNLSKIRDF